MNKVFDVNLSVGRWPFRRLPLENPARLTAALRAAGISGGLVRSLEAPFAMNIYEANDELYDLCRNHPELIPVPAVRPDFGLWRDIKAPAAALFPSYHQYSLLDPGTLEMVGALLEKKILPMIVIREEDERGQHPLCKVPPVPVAEINRLAEHFPGKPIAALNAYAGEFRFFTAPNLYADLAFSETFPALAYTVENFGTERLLFGSHAPFFCLHSELSKLDWPQLSPEQISNISSKKIERLLYGK